MSTFLGAFPFIASRTFLAPIYRLPERYTSTKFVVGGFAQCNGEDPTLFTTKPLTDILESVPSAKSFTPHPLFPLGSWQTFYSAFVETSDVDVVHYKRHVLLLPDGGIIAVDVSPPEWDSADDSESQQRSTVALSHGLTGGSHESYVRHVIPPLVASGYRCVVINFRGCGQTPVTSPQMYSAAKTDDLRSGLLWMLDRWKRTEVVLMGFSLGANIIAKYMGEEGDAAPVRGAMVFATPFDLKMGSDGLRNRPIYDKAMNRNLTNKIATSAHALALDPSLRQPLHRLLAANRYAKQNREEVKQRGVETTSLKWVDDSITRLVGGYSGPYGPFPFASADDYYKANGSIHFIHRVARPMLCLNADDDPIVPYEILTATKEAICKNPNVALGITRGGGHLGWWSRIKGSKTWITRWLGQAAKEWVEQVFQTDSAASCSDYMSRTNPWLIKDVRKVHDITYELLSENEVLEFEPANVVSAQSNEVESNEAARKLPMSLSKVESIEGEGEAATPVFDGIRIIDEPSATGLYDFALSPRHPWLKTQVLPGVRLIHPSHHPGFKGLQYPADRQLVIGATMVQSISRPHVGYLELPASSRVAGCGETFQGGKAIPGQSTDTRGVPTNQGGHHKLSRFGKKRQSLRERGTIAGL